MRIAVLHWAYAPTIGGVETHLAILGPELVRKGHEVSLLTGQPPGLPERHQVDNMTIVRSPYLDLNRMSLKEFQSQAPAVTQAIHAFLSEFNPEVIHLHNWHYFSEVPLLAVISWRERHPSALVLTAHNSWHDEVFEQLARYRDRYDAIIAVSQHTLEDMVKWGYPRERMRVVYHGVTQEWLRSPVMPRLPFPHVKGRPVIFHPARMSFAKGSLVVVEAFRRVQKVFPNAFLMLAGSSQTVDWDSVQRREIHVIQERIRSYGLQDSVGICTFAWPDILHAYDAASVVVYPSIFPEPFGIVVIEAMARGRPVVISRSGGMPEIVRHQEDGWVVEPNDADALADALLRLLQDRVLAESLGEKARRRVRAQFTAEQMVDQTEQVLLQAKEVRMSHDQPVAS